MSIFAIRGYGICCEDFREKIVPEKVFALLKEKEPNKSPELLAQWEEEYKLDADSFDLCEIVDRFCTDYCNLADLFSKADPTGQLSVDDNPNAGRSYLFCQAVMPWEAAASPFQTGSDVEEAIIAAVQKLTDLSAEEVLEYIDDIWDGGWS